MTRVGNVRGLCAAVVLLGLGACSSDTTAPPGGGSTPPPDPGPANVVVADAATAHPNQFVLTVTLHLRNDGGPGVYKVQLFGLPTTPNGADTFFGESDPVEVNAAYDESVTYTIETENFAKAALVFTRDTNTAVYRQTAELDFPL